MKKIVYVGICLLSLNFVACSEDDVKDVACEVAEGTLETAVEQTFEAWENDRDDDDKCEAAKDTIEEYRDLECTSETSYSTEYAELLLNCPG